MKSNATSWHLVENAGEIPSPAVLVYPDRIEANLRRMVALAGGPERLCPHVKSHKLPEIVRMQRDLGIAKFKCATIAEAEMLAGCRAPHVLLAYQPVGPNVARLLELAARFPATQFAAVVDNAGSAREIAAAAQHRGMELTLLLDIDCGMRRTGIGPGPAAALYRLLCDLPGVRAGGLHAYDGHIHDRDLATRTARAETGMAPVLELRAELRAQGLEVPRLVVGGTPAFAIHARIPDVECSPGTCVLWDGSSGASLRDLGFENAAIVLTRVLSKPGPDRLCLDLGHKALASEMTPPRVEFFALPDAVAVIHSEEHLVVESPRADGFAVGDVLYGIPRHICPTMALHAAVVVVRSGRAVERWRVVARDRVLTV
jgi:D-threonine aldolase